MSRFLSDLRFAVRSLLKHPGFSLVAVLTLALGIGANSAVFSFVKAALFDPLPYGEANRLVMVWQDYQRRGGPEREWFSWPNFVDYRDRSESLEDLAVFDHAAFVVTGPGGEAEAVIGELVTPNMFDVLDVRMEHGRRFLPEEGVRGAPRRTILGYDLWQRRYGGEEEIVGEAIIIDDEPHTVVGILPEEFRFPLISQAELFTVFQEPVRADRTGIFLRAVGRLTPGVSLDEARADLNTIADWIEQQPNSDAKVDAAIFPLREEIMGPVEPTLLVLLCTVAFVLLIACANVANLLLARAASRKGEIGVRTALGADRRRLIRQFLTESLVLSVLGGAVAVIFAIVGVDLLKHLAIATSFPLPRVAHIQVDGGVLLFTFGIVLLTGFLFGLAPILEIRRTDISRVLQEGAAASSDQAAGWRTGRLLVVVEMAVALVLLVGAGLMLRSLEELQKVDTGYEAEDLLVFRLQTPGTRYPEAPQVIDFYRTLIERLEALPGVTSVGGISTLPLAPNNTSTMFQIQGRAENEPGERLGAWYRSITPDYFHTAGLSVLRGRGIEPSDQGDTSRIVIVNETLARQWFPETDPIGQILIKDSLEYRIVGVVENTRSFGLTQEEPPATYFAHPQLVFRTMGIAVRTERNPTAVVPAVRSVLSDLDPSMAPINMAPMEDFLMASVASERALGLLTGVFSLLALILAAIGLYGLTTYLSKQRTREIGIRMALGAGSESVRGLVLRQALRLAALGLAVGLLAAWSLGRLVDSLLYEVGSFDPLSVTVSVIVLLAVAVLAGYLPAWRASRLDPSQVLRS